MVACHRLVHSSPTRFQSSWSPAVAGALWGAALGCSIGLGAALLFPFAAAATLHLLPLPTPPAAVITAAASIHSWAGFWPSLSANAFGGTVIASLLGAWHASRLPSRGIAGMPDLPSKSPAPIPRADL